MNSSRLHSRTPGAAPRALTLVEVMIVVVVLGIVAAIAAPMLAQTDATRLDAACRLLVADLQYAQMYALSHADALAGIRITAGNQGYAVVVGTPAGFDCATAPELVDEISDRAYATHFGSGRAAELGGVTITAYSLDGDACAALNALGALDQAATATITLQCGSRTRTISIDPFSGEATVSP